jgi:hypothetical protein
LGSVIALVLSSTSIANANIIFDNTSGGYVGGFTLNSQSWAEDDFIPTTAINNCTSQCVLNQISLSLSAVGANPVSLGLEIRDSGGSIGSLTMVTANNPGGSGLAANNLPETYEAGTSLFTPTSTINLLAGGTYWVRLTNLDLTPAFEGGDQIQWAFNSSSGSFNVNDGGDLFSVPNNSLLMKIEATPSAVPIPAAAWLMGSALLGLVSSWRRKKA